MPKDITSREYHEEIARLAHDVVDELKQEGYEGDALLDQIYERASDTIDGHQWIIYSAYVLDVIKHTNNEDMWQEVDTLEAFADKSTMEILSIIAFWAMLQDLQEEIGKLLD